MSADLRVVAFMHARPGEEDAVREAILACVGPSRKEAGCLSYVAHADRKDAALFVVIEHWASAADRERHLRSPHFDRLVRIVDGGHRLSSHVFNVLEPLADSPSSSEARLASAPVSPPPGERGSDVTLTINGAEHCLPALDAHTTLLDALRDHLHLTGTKKGCGLGHCGACTVLADGRRINSCLALAVMQQGKAIITIEGLAAGGALHPLQSAFIEHDAFQCGYCTSGQIMSGIATVAEGHAGSDDEIREWMSGNLCRCGAYEGIVAAIRQYAEARS